MGLTDPMAEHPTAPAEDCDECGFRWHGWSVGQALTALPAAGPLLGEVLEGVDRDLAARRPAPDRPVVAHP